MNPDTLRCWVKQADIDGGRRPGTTTGDAGRIKDLERENRQLKRANEILLAASWFFARELWALGLGGTLTFGIEGTGSDGAGLASAVRRHDIGTIEVVRTDRPDRRLRGKSDTINAENAARAVLAGQATAIPKTTGEALGATMAHRGHGGPSSELEVNGC